MMLRGYRTSDAALLSGPWLPGELLGLPMADWPALAGPTTVEPAKDHTEELCVVTGQASVHYTGIDWVHRRARLSIGLQPGAHDVLEPVLKAATQHGFVVLNLHRLYGWVTPAATPDTRALASAGFQREATVPGALWLDGRVVTREIWGAVRHD